MSDTKHCNWVVFDRDFYENLPYMGRYDTVSLRHVIVTSDSDINNKLLSINSSLKLKSFTVIWPAGFDDCSSITVVIDGHKRINMLTFVFRREEDGTVTLDTNSPAKFDQLNVRDRFVQDFSIRNKYSRNEKVPRKLTIVGTYEILPFPLGFSDLDLDGMDVNMITDIFNLRQNCYIWAVQKNAPSVIDFIMRNNQFIKNDDGTAATRSESDIMINVLISACKHRNSDIFERVLLKYGNTHSFYSSQLMRHITDSCNPSIITCFYKFECLREFMKMLTYKAPEPVMLETKVVEPESVAVVKLETEYIPTYRFVSYNDKRKIGIVKVLESGLTTNEGLPNYNTIYEFKFGEAERHINKQYLEEISYMPE